MKIILLKDIPKTGKKHEVKEVSDGHALNHLIPRGLAQLATASALKNLEKMKSESSAHEKVQHDLLVKNLEALKEKTVTITAKANEKGHLFKGIHTDEIVSALHGEHIEISADHIVLAQPIKEAGEHKIKVEAGNIKGEFTILIEASK